jgi:hypothetical protein
MKTKLFALLSTVALATPAGATPRNIVNPGELMVVVPGLEFLGYSRISTVEFCAEIEQVRDWTELTTDAELYSMEACLIEHT